MNVIPALAKQSRFSKTAAVADSKLDNRLLFTIERREHHVARVERVDKVWRECGLLFQAVWFTESRLTISFKWLDNRRQKKGTYSVVKA